MMFQELEQTLPANTLTPALKLQLQHQLANKIDPLLTALKNTAYARGFHAARHTSPIDITQIL
jgi:hypothetical protein